MNLKRGDRSNTVKYLQQGLRMLCINPNGTDGIFGAGTETAVKKFQSKNGLASTGVVNDSTWNTMKKQIIPIQEALLKAGYKIGTADGVAGANTYNSVIDFQKKNGLTPDGMVGTKTMQLLNAAGEKQSVLKLGSKSDDVRKVQQRLISLGYSCGNSGADGDFGQGTYNAVIAFQKKNSLNPDGQVGPKTREVLFSNSAIKNDTTSILKLGSKGDEVKKVQQRLIELGYSCGNSGADGDFGAGTYNAVRRFQNLNGLTVDGKVGEKTMAKLFSDTAIKNNTSSNAPVYPSISTTPSDLLEYTCCVIADNEGGFAAINTKPSEIITIGAIQWYGERAYSLLVEIRDANTTEFDKIMANTKILEKVQNNDIAYFKTATYSDIKDDADKLSTLLATETSQTIQINKMRKDVSGYISSGKDKGITDNQILIYYADCYNQSPKGISRISAKVTSWSKITLEELHNYASNDIYTDTDGEKKGLGLYKTRRNTTYNKAKAYNTSSVTDTTSIKTLLDKMVDIALAEEKADRFEGLPESDRGKENYNKYNAWFPSKQGNPWCACFVSWCANKAGLLAGEAGQLALIPRTTAVQEVLDFYADNFRLEPSGGEYIPQRGDIFINKKLNYSHVGIVTGYDPDTREFSTIEGNTTDDTVKQLKRPIDFEGLSGFGRNNP